MNDHAKLDEILKEGFCQMYGEMTFVVVKNSIFVSGNHGTLNAVILPIR